MIQAEERWCRCSINIVGLTRIVPLHEELPVTKGTFGLDIPLAAVVISRPDQKDRPLTSWTVTDAQGLNLVAERLGQLPEAEQIFLPTARVYELVQDDGLAIMINEAVGAVKQENWGSVEVNAQILRLGQEVKPILCLNPFTSLNKNRFIHYYGFRLRLINTRLGELDKGQMKLAEKISDSLMAGCVAALTQVWFLTGKVPRGFALTSGDGVFDGSYQAIEEDFKGVSPIRLITLRKGLTERPINNWRSFMAWAGSLRTGSTEYVDQKNDEKLIRKKSVPWVTKEIFYQGADEAFRRMFGQQGKIYLDKLEKGEQLTAVWKKLGLKW